jgi:hypothetical protein
MFFRRILGAFIFRTGVYREVANDVSFTPAAWLIVFLLTPLSHLVLRTPILLRSRRVWLIGGAMGAVAGVLAFALAAFLVAWLGHKFFKSEATFGQMVRALGLAHVWTVIDGFGLLAGFYPVLTCVLTPLWLLSILARLAASLVAIRETTAMDWIHSIGMVIIVVGLQLVAIVLASVFMSSIGFGTFQITP